MLDKSVGDIAAIIPDEFITNDRTIEAIKIYENQGLQAALGYIDVHVIEPEQEYVTEEVQNTEKAWEMLNALRSGNILDSIEEYAASKSHDKDDYDLDIDIDNDE